MDTASIPLPGTLRLRPLLPLVEPDGSCRRVFDLERAAEVDVPEELGLHLAAALECGDFDEPLIDWLVSAGLITSESAYAAPATGETAETAGRAPAGRLLLDGDLHARVDLAVEEELLACALDTVFDAAVAAGAARVVLHLACGGAFPAVSALDRVVLEAERRVHESGIETLQELALAVPAASAGNVRYLAGTPLRLRLAGEARAEKGVPPASWPAAEEAVRRVLAEMPGRLTFQAVLGPGARLRRLVRWAAWLGLSHLDVTPLGAHPDGPRARDLAAYGDDLLVLAERCAAELERDRSPLDLQPLTSVARRLLRGAAAGGAYRARGTHLTARPGAAAVLPIVSSRLAETVPAGDPRLADCAECWARRACGRSAELAAPAAGERAEPGWAASPHLCGFRRAEAAAALALARRLEGEPTGAARRRLEEMEQAPLDPFAQQATLLWQGPPAA
ncbi:MAG TPA: hypothetical protein VNJ70_05440 [Thermoanaerobaculia bacterium]|nr:hypothetical protein [Thermoanaerobaculia bacterium]